MGHTDHSWNAGRSARGAYQGSGGLRPQSIGHRAVDGEDLGQPCDAKHLQDALLGADQLQRAVVRADPLQTAHQHARGRWSRGRRPAPGPARGGTCRPRPARSGARAGSARCRRRSRPRCPRPSGRRRLGSPASVPRFTAPSSRRSFPCTGRFAPPRPAQSGTEPVAEAVTPAAAPRARAATGLASEPTTTREALVIVIGAVFLVLAALAADRGRRDGP